MKIRKIIFRGKSKRTGEWLYGDLVRNIEGAFAIVPPFEMTTDNLCDRYEVEENTIGQFTGLKDFNDNEIYDGDILKESMNDAKLLVRWSDNNGSFCLSEIVEDLQFYYDFPLGKEFLRRFSMEIVGNRWDMPELSNLKG